MNQRAAFDDTLALARSRAMYARTVPSGLDLAHLQDMRNRITDDFSESKLGRWLGWAQAAVVASGIADLEAMKEINRRHAKETQDD